MNTHRTHHTHSAEPAQMSSAATSQFGSGWAWLAATPKTGALTVMSTANQVIITLVHALPGTCSVWSPTSGGATPQIRASFD